MAGKDREGISIIISTHNRADLLHECLSSFINQTFSPDNIEFLVVDNHSEDNTPAVVRYFEGKLKNLRRIDEPNVGLSFARNRGIAESQFDWVCYVDDDAKAREDFLQQLFYTRNNFSFDGFGGMFYGWYRRDKPKWMPEDVANFRLLRKDIGPLQPGQTVAGGICAFNKKKVIEAGLFPTNIGMRGNVIGYGEEDVVQLRMWESGATIGFNPNWIIDHLVADYKYEVFWHLKRSFAKGKDYTVKTNAHYSTTQKAVFIAKAFVTPLYLVFRQLPVFLSKKNYYWQNYVIDVFSNSFRNFGRASS